MGRRPGSPVRMTPAHWQMLEELGISYRQWSYWQDKGWVPTGKDINEVVVAQARALAEASKIQTMPLNELADLIRRKPATITNV